MREASALSEELRVARRSLTLRGRGFLAAGLSAMACGIVLGERDLVGIGLLVGAMPLIAIAWVVRGGHDLVLTRSLSSAAIRVGETTSMSLTLTNAGRRTPPLRVSEALPSGLNQANATPVFWAPSLPTTAEWSARYDLSGTRRGDFRIGPLSLRLVDPFRLVQVDRTFPDTVPLLVTPAVQELPATRIQRSDGSGGGDAIARAFDAGAEADVTVRDYRRGDDLRRVHWRSTAHAGALMVRQVEQPRHNRCTVVLDIDAATHYGQGLDSSLEHAISLAASVGAHLMAMQTPLQLLTTRGAQLFDSVGPRGHHTADVATLLRRLAMVVPERGASPARGTHGVREVPGVRSTVIAILGQPTESTATLLRQLTPRTREKYAFVFADQTPSSSGALAGADQVARLREAGWKTIVVQPGSDPAQVWQELVS